MARYTGDFHARSDRGACTSNGKVRVGIVPRADDRPIMYSGEIKGVIARSKYLIGIAKAALSPNVMEESKVAVKKIIRQPVGVVV
jgi:hypothetical protein